MSSTVDRVKERLTIVDVIGSYIKIEKAGANFKARCPFHHEKTPSFFISPVRNSYYCFGCAAKGDIFSFVEAFEGIDFKGALKLLAEKAGVPIERVDPAHSRDRDSREELFKALDAAAEFYESALLKHDEALLYLKNRGLIGETIKTWRLGFAPEHWTGVRDHLKGKGVSDVIQEKAGLIKPSEKRPGDYYDRFRSRIMFPIFDASGRVIAFSGRIFGESDAPKYINSPETDLFDKSRALYGFDKAKIDIRKMDYAILVEGQMDLLSAHQAGFGNTVATSGTALTAGHLELIKRISSNMMIAYDGDLAGVSASERGWKTALSGGMNVKVVRLPKGKDPADIIVEDLGAWKQALAASEHIIDFHLSKGSELSDEQSLRKYIESKVLPYVAALGSPLEQAQYVRKIALILKVPEDAVRSALQKTKPETAGVYIEPTAKNTSEPFSKRDRGGKPTDLKKETRKSSIERALAGIMLWLESYAPGRATYEEMKNQLSSILGVEEAEALIERYKNEAPELIFEIEMRYEHNARLQTTIWELFKNYEEDMLKEKFMETMKEVEKAESLHDGDKVRELLLECQRISEKIRSIKKPPDS